MTMRKSVPATDFLNASKGMLQKQLDAIFTVPVSGLGPVFECIEDHLAFQLHLETEGVLYAPGPMWTDDEQSWEGEGLVIVRAALREDAIAITGRDPMHQRGAHTFKVRPWLVNEGSVTGKLSCSGPHSEIL